MEPVWGMAWGPSGPAQSVVGGGGQSSLLAEPIRRAGDDELVEDGDDTGRYQPLECRPEWSRTKSFLFLSFLPSPIREPLAGPKPKLISLHQICSRTTHPPTWLSGSESSSLRPYGGRRNRENWPDPF